MATKLTILIIFLLVLTVLTGLATFSLVPPENLAMPLFWVGFAVTFGIGAFLIQSLRPGMARIGAVAFGVWEFSPLYASHDYPEALVLASGFPGFFLGMLPVALYFAVARTKMAYCPVCGRKTAMERRNGVGQPSPVGTRGVVLLGWKAHYEPEREENRHRA